MWKKLLSGMLIVVMAFACIGCSGDSASSGSSDSSGIDKSKETIKTIPAEDAKTTEVIKIGDEIITLDYMYLYVIQFIFTYKPTDGTIESNMTEYKSQIISQLRTDEIEYQYAKKNGIELTEEEKKEMDGVVDKYYKTFPEEFLEKYGISRDTITNLFYKQRYITKLNDRATKELQEDLISEVEKELEGKDFYELYYLLFPTVEYNEDGKVKTDANGENVAVSADKKKEQEALATEAKERLEAGEDAEALAKEYGVEDYSDTMRSYRGAYTGELEDLIADLENGDISEVYEDSLGYMVVKMINAKDDEYKSYYIDASASQQAKERLETEKNGWLSSVEIDEENDMLGDIWKNLDITKISSDMIDEKIIEE